MNNQRKRAFSSLIMSLVFILAVKLAPTWAADLKPEILHYVADVAMFKDAAIATVTLRVVDKDKFEAVVEAQTNGLVGVFTAHRRDRYATTMQLVQGKLQPLLYIEESRKGDKHMYKEYRFDYNRQRLEMWRRGKDGAMVLKWQTDLTRPLYDPISAFYNFRIGALGEVKAGHAINIPGIPYPQPETITIQMTSPEANNRQAIVTIRSRPKDNEVGQVHARFDNDLVPLAGWTQIGLLGKITGRLVSRN